MTKKIHLVTKKFHLERKKSTRRQENSLVTKKFHLVKKNNSTWWQAFGDLWHILAPPHPSLSETWPCGKFVVGCDGYWLLFMMLLVLLLIMMLFINVPFKRFLRQHTESLHWHCFCQILARNAKEDQDESSMTTRSRCLIQCAVFYNTSESLWRWK